jgi:acyl carrier protein
VLDRPNADLADRVASLVRRVLGKRGVLGPIGCDDDLRASGLSSLDVVNLMLCVEGEFGIKIPERDMTPANFRSITRIATLIGALNPQSATAN